MISKQSWNVLHDQWFTTFDKGYGATMDGMEVPNLALVIPDGKGMIWQKHGLGWSAEANNGSNSRI